jgi:hypothetical protein
VGGVTKELSRAITKKIRGLHDLFNIPENKYHSSKS